MLIMMLYFINIKTFPCFIQLSVSSKQENFGGQTVRSTVLCTIKSPLRKNNANKKAKLIIKRPT